MNICIITSSFPSHSDDVVQVPFLVDFINGKSELSPFIKENKIEACLALWVLPSGYFANQAYRQARIPYSIWSLGSDIYRYGKNPFLYPVMKRIIQEAKGVFADGFDLSKRI